MCRRVLLVLLLLPLGCRSSGRDILERELHARERQVQQLQGELHRLEAINTSLERGFRETRIGETPCPPGSAEPTALKDITLGRGTGGLEQDRRPGDDALMVVVAPRDADNSTVKAAGTLAVTAFQITPEGLKQPFGFWELTSTELRATWRAGLLSTGYQVTLPFRDAPTRERMLVVVRFTSLSGVPYEAEQTVRIRVGCEPPRPLVAPTPPTTPPAGAEEGPPPKPVPEPKDAPVNGPELLPAATISLMPVQPSPESTLPVPTLVPFPGTEGPPGRGEEQETPR